MKTEVVEKRICPILGKPCLGKECAFAVEGYIDDKGTMMSIKQMEWSREKIRSDTHCGVTREELSRYRRHWYCCETSETVERALI